jgi:predicted phosphate transport protein (TIGR00153 family)
MNFNSVLKFFLPRDKVFYLLFEEVSNTLVQMALLLKEAVNQSDQMKRREIFKQISDLEHVNDDTTHKIFIELGQNFITPFDREDIHVLASTMDDIADFIDGASKRMLLYKIYEIDEGISRLCEVIYKSVIELKKAVHELRNMSDLRNITEACVRINSLENHADDIYDTMVAQLFENGKDAVHIIMMKETLQSLETATDKCEDAANVLESIIIKYA